MESSPKSFCGEGQGVNGVGVGASDGRGMDGSTVGADSVVASVVTGDGVDVAIGGAHP